VTTFIAFPASIGIATIAPTFVRAVFGAQWMPMVPVMQLVAIYGLFIALGSAYSPVWKAIGRPDYMMKVGVFRLVMTAAVIIPATQQFGITGTAAAVLGIYIFPVMPIDVYLVLKSVETSLGRLLKGLSYPAVASLIIMGGRPVAPGHAGARLGGAGTAHPHQCGCCDIRGCGRGARDATALGTATDVPELHERNVTHEVTYAIANNASRPPG